MLSLKHHSESVVDPKFKRIFFSPVNPGDKFGPKAQTKGWWWFKKTKTYSYVSYKPFIFN